ncbi:PDDEXK nuclease domain-containing protein [Legionella sp.]|uniref:PDDEXK nuclease domain-containing protein n=1 Tax=Legionella sp. TaxID=459 RepID=UPI003C82B87C
MDRELSNINEEQLYSDISQLIEVTQQRALHEINRAGVLLYWHIGRRINHDILKYNRAEYGGSVIKNLADKLQKKFGKGFGLRVIHRCVQFERFFSEERIVIALSQHLKWTHFVSLLNISNQLKREFYAEMCRIERWSTRELSKRIDDMLFERTAIAKKADNVIEKEISKLRETQVLEPDLIIQDPYIFSYLSSEVLNDERTLEDAILNDIEEFLLSMGKGFTFQERQKVIEIDGDFFRIDLLMFHRKLRCMVAIELKKGKFKAADKGQIELYLRWLEKYEMQPGENPPIGIVLCSEKSDERVELLQLEKSGIRVSQFITELPPKDIFEKRLHEALERAREKELIQRLQE